MYRNFIKKYPALIATALVGMATLPFANLRIMRHGGDEKVYVAQALEMMGRGDWFLQSLAGDPNYYKGPLHYLFLIFGTDLFGLQPIATLYMNFLLIGLAIYGLVKFAQTQLIKPELGIWLGVTFGLSAGVLPFMFSSQMEAELIAIYSLAVPALYYSRSSIKAEYAFWILAGLAGLTKSPLHAVLIGLGGYCYWLFEGGLLYRLTRWHSIGALAVGIGVCCAGYFPAFYHDTDNFLNTYVARETLNKRGNRHGPLHATLPIFTYNLFPWIFPSMAALFVGARWFRKIPGPHQGLVKLAICLAAPTMIFFTAHPFRSAIYCVPLMGLVYLCVTIFFQHTADRFPRLYRWTFAVSVSMLAIPVLLLAFLDIWLEPSSAWWPDWITPLAILLTFGGLAFYAVVLAKKSLSPILLSLGLIPFYLSFLAYAAVLGEGELRDARQFIGDRLQENPTQRFGFYNLHRHTWNEWGYQNYWLNQDIVGIHSRDAAIEFLQSGGILFVPGKKRMTEAKKFLSTAFPHRDTKVQIWRRWRSRAQGVSGGELLQQALKHRSISILEQEYYMVELHPENYLPLKTTMRLGN